MIKAKISIFSTNFLDTGQMSEMICCLLSVIAFFGAFLGCANTARAQNSLLSYKGFNVDYAEIKDSPQKDVILNSVKNQIDIVGQVGLGNQDMTFFKSVPIVMLTDASGTPGEYKAKNKTVYLKGKDLAADKPILLHELLHAYHHQVVPQGVQNPQIRQFYANAQKAFPNFQNEYFLTNDKEFFAVTASIYLFGSIKRPPFDRATIKNRLPNYYKFLESLLVVTKR